MQATNEFSQRSPKLKRNRIAPITFLKTRALKKDKLSPVSYNRMLTDPPDFENDFRSNRLTLKDAFQMVEWQAISINTSIPVENAFRIKKANAQLEKARKESKGYASLFPRGYFRKIELTFFRKQVSNAIR